MATYHPLLLHGTLPVAQQPVLHTQDNTTLTVKLIIAHSSYEHLEHQLKQFSEKLLCYSIT